MGRSASYRHWCNSICNHCMWEEDPLFLSCCRAWYRNCQVQWEGRSKPLDSYSSLFLVLGDLMCNVEMKQVEWKVTSVKNFSHLPTKKSPTSNHHYNHQLTPSKVEPNKSPSTSKHQFVQRPGNLLFAQPEVMKLADFGCATLAPESITLEEKLWVVRVGLVGWLVGWSASGFIGLGEMLDWEKNGVKLEKSCEK